MLLRRVSSMYCKIIKKKNKKKKTTNVNVCERVCGKIEAIVNIHLCMCVFECGHPRAGKEQAD